MGYLISRAIILPDTLVPMLSIHPSAVGTAKERKYWKCLTDLFKSHVEKRRDIFEPKKRRIGKSLFRMTERLFQGLLRERLDGRGQRLRLRGLGLRLVILFLCNGSFSRSWTRLLRSERWRMGWNERTFKN